MSSRLLMRACDNPFRASRIEALAFRSAGCSPEGLLSRWEELRRRGALVGPRGSGKTTLLEALAARLRSAGESVHLLRVPERGSARVALSSAVRAAATGGAVLAVDGAERLGWAMQWALVRLASGFAGLLLTAHRPCLVPTLHEHRTDPALFAELLGELLPTAESGPLVPELPSLFARHSGDLRACFRELYDRWARDPNHEVRVSDARGLDYLRGDSTGAGLRCPGAAR